MSVDRLKSKMLQGLGLIYLRDMGNSTPHQATVSVKFRNGTILDVAKVEGSDVYRVAMRELVEDATRVRQGGNSSLPRLEYNQPERYFVHQAIPLSVQGGEQLADAMFGSQPDMNDPWVAAVGDMVSTLHERVKSAGISTHDTAVVSFPSASHAPSWAYWRRFHLTSARARIQSFLNHYLYTFQSVIGFHGINFYQGRVYETYAQVDSILVLDYSGTSLGITLLGPNWSNQEPTQAIIEHFDHGADSLQQYQEPKQYWSEIKSRIVDVLPPVTAGDKNIEKLILIGDHATDPDFLSLVDELFSGNDKVIPAEYKRSADDHIFFAARGAAAKARVGLRTGFEHCVVPEHCPEPERIPGVSENDGIWW
ncbi:hypothetical protein AJ80_05397 [Polytolypa hystricis UAMH7299]|uniref:Uncharacterized protein n=1 Tax=Polytolypa hystricis (strain UAMH7299) TaxID=1447883 RepID=A0A2B7Y2Z7_POLH7|nr:hypothetical protein AJ80_05397 [Polytolypa hystricis UAMH7299]